MGCRPSAQGTGLQQLLPVCLCTGHPGADDTAAILAAVRAASAAAKQLLASKCGKNGSGCKVGCTRAGPLPLRA